MPKKIKNYNTLQVQLIYITTQIIHYDNLALATFSLYRSLFYSDKTSLIQPCCYRKLWMRTLLFGKWNDPTKNGIDKLTRLTQLIISIWQKLGDSTLQTTRPYLVIQKPIVAVITYK